MIQKYAKPIQKVSERIQIACDKYPRPFDVVYKPLKWLLVCFSVRLPSCPSVRGERRSVIVPVMVPGEAQSDRDCDVTHTYVTSCARRSEAEWGGARTPCHKHPFHVR